MTDRLGVAAIIMGAMINKDRFSSLKMEEYAEISVKAATMLILENNKQR